MDKSNSESSSDNDDTNNNFPNNTPGNHPNGIESSMARTYIPTNEESLFDDEDEESKEEARNPIIISKSDKQKIEKFVKSTKEKKCMTFILDFKNYVDRGNENGFTIFQKKNRSSSSNNNLIQHRSKSEIQLVSYTKKSENIAKLSKMKNQFLSHVYKTFPSTFDQNYLLDQIECYMKNGNVALANFKGFSVTNKKGNFFPTFLIERPVNNSISLLFETIQKNKSENSENEIKRTKSYNADDLKVFNPDQKFALICGITNGIAFIHKNIFVHSNLNPKTVYLDENFFPKICDYIFIPSFKVTKREKKGKKISLCCKFDDKDACFDDQIYVAPEIIKGGEFGQPADIYNLGLLMYFILAEKDPIFDKNGCIIYPDNFGEEWKELIGKCISVDADSRPKAKEILEELLDDDMMTKFISAISAKSSTEILEKNKYYFKSLKKSIDSQNKEYDIFHSMIANQVDIDDETELIISAAERGDAESLKKVGDFFFYGQNNILQDKRSAYDCYKEAAEKGNIEAMILVAQCNEEGIGCEIKYKTALKYYKMANEKMNSSDPKSKIISNVIDIKSKYEEMKQKIEQSQTITLINVPLNVERQAIKKLFPNYNMKIEIIKKDDHQQVKMIFEDDINYNNVIKKQAKKDFFIIDNEKIKFTYQSRKTSVIARFDSLRSFLPLIDIDDYYPGPGNKEFESIGSGSYAITYLVYKKDDPTKCYAAKVLKSIENEQQMNSFKREVISASKFNHPAIVRYAGFSEFNLVSGEKKIKDNPTPTLLMNFIPKGNLETIIKERPDEWNDTTKLIVIIGIVNGMAEIYIKNIIHRDLKPENILLNENFEPVICDFGCSRQFSNNKTIEMSKKVGSTIYMAPELLFNENPIYKFEVDIYSFGIILYQIIANKTWDRIYPWAHKDSYLKILQDKQNDYVGEIPDDAGIHQILKDLVKSCWNISTDCRPDPVTILNELLNAVNKGTLLLPSADLSKVSEYIKKLPKY